MKNTFGTSVCITLFGESHGPAVVAVVDDNDESGIGELKERCDGLVLELDGCRLLVELDALP